MFYINWDKVIYHLITFIFDDILYYIYDVSFYNNKYIILTINNTDDQLKKTQIRMYYLNLIIKNN